MPGPRTVIVLLVGLLPALRLKNRLLNRLGHRVHPSARIHPIVLNGVGRLEMGPDSDIWSGNRFSHLRVIRLGSDVTIMRFNHFSADPAVDTSVSPEPELAGVLQVGDHTVANKGHDIDCTGGFVIGEWSGLGGRQIAVFSHEFDPRTGSVVVVPTRVGSNSMVAARTTLAVGSRLPDFCALGIGSVLQPGAEQTHQLYAGAPAKPVREVGHWKAMAERGSRRPGLHA